MTKHQPPPWWIRLPDKAKSQAAAKFLDAFAKRISKELGKCPTHVP